MTSARGRVPRGERVVGRVPRVLEGGQHDRGADGPGDDGVGCFKGGDASWDGDIRELRLDPAKAKVTPVTPE